MNNYQLQRRNHAILNPENPLNPVNPGSDSVIRNQFKSQSYKLYSHSKHKYYYPH